MRIRRSKEGHTSYDKAVQFDDGEGRQTTNWIDLYKRGCFIMEAKQGSTAEGPGGPNLFDLTAAARGKHKQGTARRGTAQWDAAMKKAKGQALGYVHALPPEEGNPPFIIVVDVGYTFEIYADFSRLGKTYSQFPDAQSYRIALKDLADENVRDRLAAIWLDPLGLDPTRHSAKVTRKIAEKLAALAKSFEAAGHDAEHVATFLMRCLFTFFAEDVGLIDRDRVGEQPFTELLKNCRGKLELFVPMVQNVWSTMDAGGFSPAMRRKLKHFNGKLFKECQAIPVTDDQLELLIEAGESDWSDVEPAIFGTLLERALDVRERHKLGAHYTPRAYVERLVLPTVIEPLRERWDAARAAAFTLNMQGKNEDARKAVHDFLVELCNTTVLDPACGSGNFLYVTMEHMKKLEGEVRDELRQLGETQEPLERAGLTVDPHQFLGLELNPRAVAVAELVLWIGYLKWHLRTLGHAPAEPLLKAFNNIKQQDAVLAYDSKELVRDEHGTPVTRWDGRTMKVSPVTGEEVPDETARTPVYRYINPRISSWPSAAYAVGNPPFIGNKRMREALGDGYVDALRTAHPSLQDNVDFVMYWWDIAAHKLAAHQLTRFGFITTNSITQVFNRRVLANHLGRSIHLSHGIPDHPWVDSSDGAAVRIAMTVAAAGPGTGTVLLLRFESPGTDGERAVAFGSRSGAINADISVGADVASCSVLHANDAICFQGPIPVGEGFRISPVELNDYELSPQSLNPAVKRYVIGRDLMQRREERYIIDFFGLTREEAQASYPRLFQKVLTDVKPHRDANNDPGFREKWWLWGRPRPEMRLAIAGLHRYIATCRTAAHRVFMFLEPDVIPDTKIIAIASGDAAVLAVLSSSIHVTFANKAGGWLGAGNDATYNHVDCFTKFPFPPLTNLQFAGLRSIGESLDAHRKRQQAAHPGLTITDMYNVLAKLRSGEPLTEKDKLVHEQGLVSVLRQIHNDLDAAVAEAYGWPVNLSDDEILRRLVALNAERADEERRGIVRWLRPEFQNPTGSAAPQGALALPAAAPTTGKKATTKRPPWPKGLAEQARAVRAALQSRGRATTAEELARTFTRAPADKVADLLETLATLGQARAAGEGRYVA